MFDMLVPSLVIDDNLQVYYCMYWYISDEMSDASRLGVKTTKKNHHGVDIHTAYRDVYILPTCHSNTPFPWQQTGASLLGQT